MGIKRNSRIQQPTRPAIRGVLYQEETKTLGSRKINDLHFSFLRSTRLGRFWPELPIKEITLEQLPHQPKTHSKTAAYRGNCGGSFLGGELLNLALTAKISYQKDWLEETLLKGDKKSLCQKGG
jgi:hypothetical protein